MEAANLAGGNEAILIKPSDLIARVIAQTCRQSGLSAVYTELLDFAGAEIYYTEQPALVGKSYRDTLDSFTDSTVMGIFRRNETVMINPPMDTCISDGDRIIVISEDDDTIRISGIVKAAIDKALIRSGTPTVSAPERTIILGCSALADLIIQELDNYVAAGSQVTVVAPNDISKDRIGKLSGALHNQSLSHQIGNTTERAVLDALDVASFDHVILLCSSDLEVQEADARTLITLLHLRNIAEENGMDLNIVSEMLDPRNQALAEVARADDFIVSDKLVSLMLAQVSENKHLNKVFNELFLSEGSEIYLKPIGDYIVTGQETDFFTLIDSAAERGETAIGFRIAAESGNAKTGYGVNCNPNKLARMTFADGDKIIVLAEQ
jgi:Trk K+ transport system NAD-binding subunit